MTREFTSQLARLASLKFPPATLEGHWEALNGLRIEDLARAVGQALRECDTFPAPAELLRLADRTAPALPPPTRQEWRDYCDRCRDTGWWSLQCPAVSCGRDFDHAPHEFVQRCACWDSNPALLRTRQRQAQQAAHRTAKQERG